MPYPLRSSWPPGSPGERPGPHSVGLRALASLGKFGLSNRRFALQSLTLLHRVLELLLDLADPGLELLTGGLLLNSLPLGFGQGIFQGLNLGRRPYTYYDTPVSTNRLLFLNTQQVVTHLASCGAQSSPRRARSRSAPTSASV